MSAGFGPGKIVKLQVPIPPDMLDLDIFTKEGVRVENVAETLAGLDNAGPLYGYALGVQYGLWGSRGVLLFIPYVEYDNILSPKETK